MHKNRIEDVTPSLEFSRRVAVEGIIFDRPRREKITASAEECAALAKRFGLIAVEELAAEMTLLRLSEGKILRIEGKLTAEVVQTCVVSLQGVAARIEADFDTCFTEDGKEFFEGDDELDPALEEEFPDRVMENGELDMGELVAQYLALELDPYPRAPGVSLPAQMTEKGEAVKSNPFQGLKNLKSDDDE
jgi:uncharacterized metal-binding protein YceD (DUF177 family)